MVEENDKTRLLTHLKGLAWALENDTQTPEGIAMNMFIIARGYSKGKIKRLGDMYSIEGEKYLVR